MLKSFAESSQHVISLSLQADLCEKSSLDIQSKSDVKSKRLQLCAPTLQVPAWTC